MGRLHIPLLLILEPRLGGTPLSEVVINGVGGLCSVVVGLGLLFGALLLGDRWFKRWRAGKIDRWKGLPAVLGLEVRPGPFLEIRGQQMPDPLFGTVNGYEVSLSIRQAPAQRDGTDMVEGGPETWVEVELGRHLGLGWSDPRASESLRPGALATSGTIGRASHWLVTGGGKRKEAPEAVFDSEALRPGARQAVAEGFTILVADELLALRDEGIVVDARRLRRAIDAAVAMATVLSNPT